METWTDRDRERETDEEIKTDMKTYTERQMKILREVDRQRGR